MTGALFYTSGIEVDPLRLRNTFSKVERMEWLKWILWVAAAASQSKPSAFIDNRYHKTHSISIQDIVLKR